MLKYLINSVNADINESVYIDTYDNLKKCKISGEVTEIGDTHIYGGYRYGEYGDVARFIKYKQNDGDGMYFEAIYRQGNSDYDYNGAIIFKEGELKVGDDIDFVLNELYLPLIGGNTDQNKDLLDTCSNNTIFYLDKSNYLRSISFTDDTGIIDDIDVNHNFNAYYISGIIISLFIILVLVYKIYNKK